MVSASVGPNREKANGGERVESQHIHSRSLDLRNHLETINAATETDAG